MKIVHIAAGAPYNDGWGYQENLLPRYQKKLGHDVTLITTNTKFENGRLVETDCADYRLDDGVRVIRLKKKSYGHPTLTNLHARLPISNLLKELRPDFIFVHGLVSDNIYDAVAYKQSINPDCVIVQDNHLDYRIGRAGKGIKERVVRQFSRRRARKTMGDISRVYGVTPWRKQYAQEYYQVPADKTDVLIMGADDEKLDFEHREEIRRRLRSELEIDEDDFLVITGGKIDEGKNIHLLMQAAADMEKVKLVIFGQVLESIKEKFDALLLKYENIRHIGWLPADGVYDYFFAADLVFFPGQHSVLWEQACAAKVPCVFKRWEGMEHVNNGGNSDFLDEVSVTAIRRKLEELRFTDAYCRMKRTALSDKTDLYLYSHIAKKSLECGKTV